MTTVKISAAHMRQIFHGCEPDYIRDVCHGACCRSSTEPSGVRIALLPAEVERFTGKGLPVVGGYLQPVPGQRRCPHQQAGSNLCGLHDTPDKPFGCIASPFILTARDTLIVRNRYRLLKCYRDGELPAYRAFAASLVLLFGREEASAITRHLDSGGGDISAEMLPSSYAALEHLQGRP